MKNIHLICIDAQNDFCDPNGSLYVKGGDQNVGRVAKMIERLIPKLSSSPASGGRHSRARGNGRSST